jgi:hypothetical protein
LRGERTGEYLCHHTEKEAEPFALKKAVGSPFLFSLSLRCVLDTLLNLWYNMAGKNNKGESL